MKVNEEKKGYEIKFENGKSLENNGYKKRDIDYISLYKCVKVEDLLYKNEIDIIIHKVIKVSLNGDSVINSTKNKVIYC